MNETEDLISLIEVQNYQSIWEDFFYFAFYPNWLSIIYYGVSIALLVRAYLKKEDAVYYMFSFWVVSFGGIIAVKEMVSSFNGSHNYFETGIPELKLACSAIGFVVRTSIILLFSTLIYRPAEKTLLEEAYAYLRPIMAICCSISLDGLILLLLLFYGM